MERFFRDITINRLRRGVFTSLPELVAAIDEHVAHQNTKPKPFIWTKTAASCKRSSAPDHGSMKKARRAGACAPGGDRNALH